MDKISFRSNGSLVADRDLYTNMTNTNQQAVLIIDIEETITNSQVSKLKNLYKGLFEDESCSAQSAKDVHNAFIDRLKTEIDSLRSIKNVWHFEFVKPLEEIVPMLEQLKGNVYPGLYSKTAQIEAAIDRKVEEADVISEFINNPQFSIFKRIDTLKNGNQANLVYVTAELKNTLEEIYKSTTPWKLMTKAKEVLDAISDEIKAKQESACEEVLSLLKSKMQSLTAVPSYASLEENQKQKIIAIFEVLKAQANEERYIGNLIAIKGEVSKAYDRCLDSINHWVEDKQEEERRRQQAAQQTGGQTSATHTAPKIVHKVVKKEKAMTVPFDKQVLETKEDVEKYLAALKEQLMHYIDQNNNIMLN